MVQEKTAKTRIDKSNEIAPASKDIRPRPTHKQGCLRSCNSQGIENTQRTSMENLQSKST